MKNFFIKKIAVTHELRADTVPQLMLAHGIPYHRIACVNWPEAFPYAPLVEVALAHTGTNLLAHFRVEENCIRAIAEEDGGRVWEDSCCELFLQPTQQTLPLPLPIMEGSDYPSLTKTSIDGVSTPLPSREGQGGGSLYYNLECNCAGTLLVAVGEGRHNRQPATKDVMTAVQRWSSLAQDMATRHATSEETSNVLIPLSDGSFTWHMALVIPATTFFASDIHDLSGLTMRGNIYKCGDKLSTPHFLSLFPIATENPDFHRPEFFSEILFSE